MTSNSTYEMRQAREDLRFARFWDARIQEPEHPLALLAKAHPEFVEVVRQIARNAFISGVRFAEREAGLPKAGLASLRLMGELEVTDSRSSYLPPPSQAMLAAIYTERWGGARATIHVIDPQNPQKTLGGIVPDFPLVPTRTFYAAGVDCKRCLRAVPARPDVSEPDTDLKGNK